MNYSESFSTENITYKKKNLIDEDVVENYVIKSKQYLEKN